MKTISSRFLKAAVAMLLIVLMIFGSTVSSFAAVVDKAETGGNISANTYFYWENKDNWTDSTIQLMVGHSGWSQGYKMTKISNTNLYYVKMPSWGGCYDLAVFGVSGTSAWGGEGKSISGRKQWASHSTTVYNSLGNTTLSGSYLLDFVSSSQCYTKLSSTFNSLDYAQKAYVYSASSGSSSFSGDSDAGTVTVSAYEMTGDTSASTATATLSNYTYSFNAALSTKMTLTATAETGYNFVGWYDAETGGSLLSSSASYTVDRVSGAGNYYARFQKAGFEFTVTAGTGGTVNPTSGTGASVDITATPNDGYKFVKWETTGGSVADTSDPTTTFTITAANANAHATFAPEDYKVTLNTDDGTINSGNVTGYTFGNTVPLPTDVTKTGYTFKGWKDDSGNTVTQINSTDFGDKTYTAQWQINTYTITVKQNAGGSTKVGSNTAYTGTTDKTYTYNYGDSVTVVVTPNTTYKISGISGAITSGESESAVTKTFTVTDNATITVNFALAKGCSVHFAKGNATQNLVIGGTYTNTASADATYCTGDKTVKYSSSDTSVATVDADGKVTAVKPGTAVITATCKTDTSAKATYEVHVLAPELTFDEITLDVNGTADADDFRNVADAPVSSYTVTYTAITTGEVRITTAGAITAMAPTTGVQVTAKITCDSWSKTVTFPVSVNNVTLNFNPKAVNLITGQTMAQAFTASASGYAGKAPTITIESEDTSVMTLENNKGTAVGTNGNPIASTTIKATFVFNDFYKPYATSNVKVSAPVVEVPGNTSPSASLEFGEGATNTSATFDISTNAAVSDVEPDPVEVSSANANVATASIDDAGKLTITATGVGKTNVTVTFLGAELIIPVTVTKYDPWAYVYFTDDMGWGNVIIYTWNGTNTVVTDYNTWMIKIGKDAAGKDIFAYRFDKNAIPDNVIFKRYAGDNWKFKSQDGKLTDAAQQGYFINQNNSWSVDQWSSVNIKYPTVSVDDVVVAVGDSAQVTAESNGLIHKWSTAEPTVATVTGDTATATVSGVAPGETDITVRAFIDTTDSTLASVYSDNVDAYPFISTEATATVTVGSVDFNLNVNAKYSDDGINYVEGTTGGTVSATLGEEEFTSFPVSVPYGAVLTLHAKEKTGYRFVGWSANDGEIITNSADDNDTIPITADRTYTAHFVKTYKVTVLPDSGIDLVKYNNVPSAVGFTDIEVDAGATITVYASPKENNKFIGWTDLDGNTVSTMVNYTLTVNGDLTLKANSVPSYTAVAQAQTNKYFGEYGGTVKINGQTSPQQFLVDEKVTFTAEPENTNYYFAGWYSDVEFTNLVSADATYETTMTEDGITLFGLFVKEFYLKNHDTGEIDVTFKYDIATNSYYSDDTDYVEKFIVTSNDGVSVNSTDVTVSLSSSVGLNNVFGHYTSHYVLTPDTENYDIESPVTYTLTPDLKADGTADGTYTLSIALSDAEKVEISVDGTKVADKAIGSTFEYEIDAPDGQYLSGATITPNTPFEIVDGKIKFAVPNTNVNIDPEFTNYSYVEFTDPTGLTITGLKGGYKAGEAVEITVAPATEQVTISAIVADNEAAVITKNGNDWTITIDAMPADTYITITPSVDAKFMMDYGMYAIGNYGSGYTTYGTVAMAIGDTALAKGGYADKTETVTYTATPNTNFIFDGWYSGESCETSQLLSRETSYDVTPTADTTVYALFVPKHYLAPDQSKVATNFEMTYDPETRTFHYTSSDISKTAWFRVSNNKTTSAWTDDNSYAKFDSSFNVTFNANAYMVTVGWGTQCYALTSDSTAEYPYEIIVEIHGNSSIDVSCKANKTGNSVWLSSGRLDLPGSYVAADFEANIKYTHIEDTANPADVYVANEGENREKYRRLNVPEAQTVSFEVQITGTRAADYEVDTFVVYHINTESYTLVLPETKGNNTYAGSVFVDGDAYIVPIYFLTEEYAEANNLAEIDIYFDATAIKDQAWGPFVACYAWGSNNTEYNGGWSGQMMIPTEDGLSFYTMLTVPKSDDPKATSVPNGVTFNNYMQSTVPGSNAGGFSLSATQYQCYDYREPITLYEGGYEVITFVAKDSTDGYHGDRGSGVTENTITTTKNIFDNYHFDYLYSRDGKTPMDLNGEEIENPVNLKVGKADYYIVNKGDIKYDPTGTTYVGDEKYDADWAVDWYVFDGTGKHLTTILSTAMWDDIDNKQSNGLYTRLHEALGTDAAGVAGKTVAISYEHENNADHQVSYDGQWYGNMLDHTITGNVLVGLLDADNKTYTIDDDNVADYGEGYLVDENGEKHPTLDISMDLGEASLSAVRKDGYRFIGWHTRQPNGTYKLISNAYDYTTYINNNTTYYAIFKQIQSGEVVINHAVYKNTDPAIPDHGGVSEMSIEVYNKNGLLVSSTPSTSRSTTSFEGTDGETYTIKVITKPLMNGQFFAWYTDSENSDGTKTYEEILTDPNAIGKTETVSAEFEYTFDNSTSLKNINIYSDVRRVSNKANLYYKYRNRYGDIKTYTVKDYVLTDDECGGYVGNEKIEYCPTFLTWCEGKDPQNKDFAFYLHPDRIAEYEKEGYQFLDTYNLIEALAPKEEVTEAFGQEIKWLVTEVNLTTASSEIILVATQADLEYTINYDMPGDKNYITKYYNQLVEIEAPATDADGNNFSYWWEPATGEILTYNRFYNYRVVENKTIVAEYGADLEEDWTPSVNSVTYTREFDDNGDYIYTDFLLAYNNVNGAKVADLIAEGKDINYGYFLVRNPADVITTSADAADPEKYPKFNKYDADWVDGLQTVINNNKSTAITVDGKNYNCYFYNLTGKQLTNFNRCDAFIRYDNTKLDKQNVLYRQYAFTAVAYIIAPDKDGNLTLYLSNGLNVNFFDLGNEETTKN